MKNFRRFPGILDLNFIASEESALAVLLRRREPCPRRVEHNRSACNEIACWKVYYM